MALFEEFYVIRREEGEFGEEVVKLKSIDLERVESFELLNEGETWVHMYSGQDYVLRIDYLSFGEIVRGAVDGMDRLFMFNQN